MDVKYNAYANEIDEFSISYHGVMRVIQVIARNIINGTP